MIANAITLSRLPLLLAVVLLLYQSSSVPRIIAAFLIIILILMDCFDGMIARSRGESSLLGSVLDIATDRTVEFVLWVLFADLELIPVFIPLIVLVRGTFVDAIRAVAPSKGLAPFELMRSKTGRFLVKSPLLRSSFGIAKAVAFFLLALTHGLLAAGSHVVGFVQILALTSTWFAFSLCLLRGIPVLIEAPRVLLSSN